MMPAPSPISGSAPGGTAVLEVLEDAQSALDDVVRLAVLQVGDEADAAGVVLVRGIVKTLGLINRGAPTPKRGIILCGRSPRRDRRH